MSGENLRKPIKVLDVDAPNKSTALVNGKTSGIVNWNEIDEVFYDLYKAMEANYWIPDSVKIKEDIPQWKGSVENSITSKEKEVFREIIALLSVLDSVQPIIARELEGYITDASIKHLLAMLSFQETIHNRSYSYVLSTLEAVENQNKAFEIARTDERIHKRNAIVLDVVEAFKENPTVKNFAKAVVAAIVLEGINFYSAFAFFYNLARHQKMVLTSSMISYINRDEMVHMNIFSQILRRLVGENPEIDEDGEFSEWVYDFFDKAVELEVEWSTDVLEGVEGIEPDEIRQHIRYLANKRLRVLGMDDLYEEDANVLPWIHMYNEESLNNNKSDFFEQKSRQYSKVTEGNGFDEL